VCQSQDLLRLKQTSKIQENNFTKTPKKEKEFPFSFFINKNKKYLFKNKQKNVFRAYLSYFQGFCIKSKKNKKYLFLKI
jgi:hypothetical protein